MRQIIFASILALSTACSGDSGKLSGQTSTEPSTAKKQLKKKSSTSEDAEVDKTGQNEEIVKNATPTDTPKTGGVNPPPVPTATFSFSASQPVSQNLGTSKTYTYTLTPAAGFKGKAELAIDNSAFSAVDTANATQITVSPASVDFSSGTAQTATVTVVTAAMSPSIKATDSAGHFNLIGKVDGAKVEQKVELTIAPIFEIQMKGSSAATMVYTPNLTTISFKKHADGLKLRFLNMDTAATNIVHGNGSIPHQNTGMPMPPSADGVSPGGMYEVNVAATATTGSFYSHSYEANGAKRTVTFNQ